MSKHDKPKGKLSGKEYNAELSRLHAELVALQEWVKATGAKVCVVFEGRDSAGKGGTIKALTGKVSPACSEWLRCRARPIGRSRRCTSSGTSSTFPGQARS